MSQILHAGDAPVALNEQIFIFPHPRLAGCWVFMLTGDRSCNRFYGLAIEEDRLRFLGREELPKGVPPPDDLFLNMES